MEPRIIDNIELAKEKLFESKIKELGNQYGKPIKASPWKGLTPELLFENAQQFDRSAQNAVFGLYEEIFG